MTTEAPVTSAAAYHSDLRPDMAPFEEQLGSIRGFTFAGHPRRRDRGGHPHRPRGAGPARRHARDPRDGGDDRPPARRRLRPAPGLRLPRTHARLDRPGGLGGRRLHGAPGRRQRHQLSPRPRRRDRQGLRRDPHDVRRAAQGAGPGLHGHRPGRAAGGRARGARLPRDRRAVRQGRGLRSRARRRHAHRGLLDRQPRRQRHRRRFRPDRDRRGDGPPLRAERQGGVLLRRRRRVRQRRRPGVAQLGGAGPVDQPPRGRSRARPADHLLHPEQPLRHDPPHRRRGHGGAAPRAAGCRVRDEQHARRGGQRDGRAGRARRGTPRRRDLPRRARGRC